MVDSANLDDGPVRIRRATILDLGKIDHLANAVLREYGTAEDSAVEERDSRYFEPDGLIKQGHAQFWVAVAEPSTTVGAIAVVPRHKGTALLKTLYVARSYRGKGLGLRLYETAEAFARKAGYDWMCLYTSRDFVDAISFYERMGFVLTLETDNVWRDNWYEKRIRD